MFEKELAEIISKKTKLKKQEIVELIEKPKFTEQGDYAFPCFILSKQLKKNPNQISEELAKEIKPKDIIEKIESKGPYLNFFINKKEYTQRLLKEINESYGKSKIGKNQKIVIDFSGPNIGKPMHVGHIRSTIIGDSLMRIYSYLGYKPTGINYLGDVGLHIGKLIVAYELWLDKEALKKDPVKELLRLYVKFNEKENVNFEEGLDEEEETENEWTIKAKEKLELIELGDKATIKIWDNIRKHSGKAFDKVYKMLNVNFHETTGQSKFGDLGREVILEQVRKGKAKTEGQTGAVYIEFKNLPKKFILRTGGIPSYITQDIGAAISRYERYNFNKMIYVTDFRQELHFKQLFLILKEFGYNFPDKCEHLGFGTVKFGKEILATRKGKVILLEEVLQKTIDKAKENIKKKKTKGDPEKIGTGAIKYTILRNEPIKDVQFSWEEALNFEGETGPYLQYAYARANSILKKSKRKPKLTIPDKIDEKEFLLIKKMQEFPKLVEDAEKHLNPSIIANYSYQLAKVFNEFYVNSKVIGSENEEFLLKLIETFKITLKNSLYLLGIEIMEEM